MSEGHGPEWWANKITLMLNVVQGDDRFPVDVEQLALEYTKQVFPEDPITGVVARDFDGFDGVLTKGKNPGDGWRIGYSKHITSPGRKRFTIAHELGHYFAHRLKYPNGVACTSEDLAIWDSEYNRVEAEANSFAASLLLPLDAFRKAIPANSNTTIEDLGEVARRFGVSLTAASLRWLGYTEKRAILVVSREGYILWSRSSKPALRSGAYFKTKDVPPREVPSLSPVLSVFGSPGYSECIKHAAGVWLNESSIEHSLISDNYDLGISLLMLENSTPRADVEEEQVEDTFDRFTNPQWR